MNPPPTGKPEERARENIDAALQEAGWSLQNRDEMNLSASRGIAVREFKLTSGHGFADYLLFVDQKAVGVLEAKPEGFPLTGVEPQLQKYADGLPSGLNPPVNPLPFLYLSTGAVTKFVNLLDPHPRSRRVFCVHRPETLAEWLSADTLDKWVQETGAHTTADDSKPSSLRARLRAMPPLQKGYLFPNQVQAITNLERSLREDRPRALVQMATGSGKTRMTVAAVYRLIKFGGARRVLFLVDRSNLGEQADKEFKNFRSPDDNRKFDELYNVQHLQTNTIGSSAKVVITTIQRLFSMLQGREEFDPEVEEGSQFETGGPAGEAMPVEYNPSIPPEFFDLIVVDECHRSIYSVWRQVLEYFDAHLVGLTATPAKHTFGFFDRNLVMEYGHEEAVADGVNVDFEVYKIRTRITEEGSTIEASGEPTLGVRDRRTRKVRWETPDEGITYGATELDRKVVAKDQIRTIIKTFRDKVRTEIFPGRKDVPKTLIFAKDDNHAEDIVEIVREEFVKGNEFCQKITYKVTGKKPKDLIQEFRNQYYPRIVVTVDLIATGTDIRPIEVVMFMRIVKSRVLFEQMKGRGVRIIDKNELKGVTPDAEAKTHFVIVDCVGATESELQDSQPLERQKTVPMRQLMEHIAMGGTDPDVLSSVASRLARLDKQCSPEQRQKIQDVAGGTPIKAISHAIVDALDPDRQIQETKKAHGIPDGEEPTEEQVRQTAVELCKKAIEPLATKPALRTLVEDIRKEFEILIDQDSEDAVLETGMSASAKEKAKALVTSFEQFLRDNKDEIDALQFFFSQPYQERLHFKDIKALAEAIEAPPRSWTPEKLWHAYEMLQKDKVKAASGKRLLTDIVSLVRFALRQEDQLAPYSERVHARFEQWMGQQRDRFTPEQRQWLEMIRDHVATSLEIELEDLTLTPFVEEGGLGKAKQVFGDDLGDVLKELNEELAA